MTGKKKVIKTKRASPRRANARKPTRPARHRRQKVVNSAGAGTMADSHPDIPSDACRYAAQMDPWNAEAHCKTHGKSLQATRYLTNSAPSTVRMMKWNFSGTTTMSDTTPATTKGTIIRVLGLLSGYLSQDGAAAVNNPNAASLLTLMETFRCIALGVSLKPSPDLTKCAGQLAMGQAPGGGAQASPIPLTAPDLAFGAVSQLNGSQSGTLLDKLKQNYVPCGSMASYIANVSGSQGFLGISADQWLDGSFSGNDILGVKASGAGDVNAFDLLDNLFIVLTGCAAGTPFVLEFVGLFDVRPKANSVLGAARTVASSVGGLVGGAEHALSAMIHNPHTMATVANDVGDVAEYATDAASILGVPGAGALRSAETAVGGIGTALEKKFGWL